MSDVAVWKPKIRLHYQRLNVTNVLHFSYLLLAWKNICPFLSTSITTTTWYIIFCCDSMKSFHFIEILGSFEFFNALSFSIAFFVLFLYTDAIACTRTRTHRHTYTSLMWHNEFNHRGFLITSGMKNPVVNFLSF